MKTCRFCAEEIKDEARVCWHCGRPQGAGDPVGSWIAGHFTLVLSLATFWFLTFQLARISRLEIVTMEALIQSAGPASIITGLVMAQYPLFLMISAFGASWWLLRTSGRAVGPWLALAALLFVALFTIPWPFFVGLLVVAASSLALGRSKAAPRAADAVERIPVAGGWVRRWRSLGSLRETIVFGTLIGAFIGYSLLRPSIWLPSESIATSDRGQLVGYVVSEGSGWTTVLTDQGRLVRERSDRIEGRDVCALGTGFPTALRLRPLQAIGVLLGQEYPVTVVPPCT